MTVREHFWFASTIKRSHLINTPLKHRSGSLWEENVFPSPSSRNIWWATGLGLKSHGRKNSSAQKINKNVLEVDIDVYNTHDAPERCVFGGEYI